MSIANEHREYIQRMANPNSEEALIQVGNIWYGADGYTTLSGLYYFTNKNIVPIPGLRVESAISMSNSYSPIDSIQIELVVNYLRFKSHIQKLFALAQCCVIIPIMNPLVAALLQPMQQNKKIYIAYGIDQTALDWSSKYDSPASVLLAYASTPIMVKIDSIHLESIANHPRELRVVMKVTKVLTTTTYGDKTLYIKTIDGAIEQSKIMDKISSQKSDTPQVDAMARMFGVSVPKIREMMKNMSGERYTPTVSSKDIYMKKLKKVLAGDIFEYIAEGQSTVGRGSIFGIDAPINKEHINEYKLSKKYKEQIPGGDKSKLALEAWIKSALKDKHRIKMIDEGHENYKLTSPKGKISKRYQLLIESKDGIVIDIGEQLIKSGYAYPTKELIEHTSHPLHNTYMEAWSGESTSKDTIEMRKDILPGYSPAMSSYTKIYTLQNIKVDNPEYTPYMQSNNIYQLITPTEYRRIIKKSFVGITTIESEPRKDVTLVSITDGDTLIVDYNGEILTARLLGIDTPETVDGKKGRKDAANIGVSIETIIMWGNMATDFVKSQISPGDSLILRFGQKAKRDTYNRLLSFVYLPDERMLNRMIIQEGYAAPLPADVTPKYNKEFNDLYKEAAKDNKGIWEYWVNFRP